MPDTEWSGSSGYGGKKAQSSPVLSLLATIKQDIEQEIVTGRADEKTAQAAFEKERKAIRESFVAQEKAITETQTEMAEVKAKVTDIVGERSVHEAELKEQEEMGDALVRDCEWVKTEFENRRKARKIELDGLAEAKDFLAGVESGDGV